MAGPHLAAVDRPRGSGETFEAINVYYDWKMYDGLMEELTGASGLVLVLVALQ